MTDEIPQAPGPGNVALFSSCLPGWSSERVVEAASRLGFPAVEWGIGPGEAIERRPDGRRVLEMSQRVRLACAGLSVQDPEASLASPRAASAYVKLAIAVGAPHIRFVAAPYRGGKLATQQLRHRRTVDRLIELAAPAGVKVIVETSPDTLAPTPELALALIGDQPPQLCGVLYDPGNMVIEGHVSPPLAIAIMGPRIAHVHVKNIAWSRTGGTWRWKHAGLAAGLLDWTEIFRRLVASEYRGYYSIDHLGGRATDALLRRESIVLRRLLAAGGTAR